MKRLLLVISVAILAAGPFAVSAGAQEPVRGKPSAELQNFVRTSYIFKMDASVSRGRIPARAAALVGQAGGTLGFVYDTIYGGFSAQMTSVAADNLFRNNDDVIGYSRDGIVTIVKANPTKKPSWAGGGGSEEDTGQQTPWGIKRVGCDPATSTNCIPGSGTGKAWIIDTGIDLTNSDLKVDLANSENFVWRGKNSPNDGNGHGTHVAGTVAAINNNIGVVGVAPGVQVVAVRVLDNSGSGSYSGVMAGINHVAANAAVGDVANISLGGPQNDALDQAVIDAAALNTVKFAIAAGNSSADANDQSPANADGDNIYTVSAIDSNDNFASFSNFANPPIDFAAPGVGVLSLKKGGGVVTYSGTSMAAPHVAGLLLFGAVNTDKYAKGDPDDNDDPIAHR